MTNTADIREIEQFSLLSNRWWDKSGPFSALHKMSNARIEFIIYLQKEIDIRIIKSAFGAFLVNNLTDFLCAYFLCIGKNCDG